MFRDWQAFFLLILLILPALLYRRRRGDATLRFSSLRNIKRLRGTWTLKARHALFLLRIAALVLIVFALARPQQGAALAYDESKGIDIQIVLDMSLSMRSVDLDPRMARPRETRDAIETGRLDPEDLKDRLEVAKEVISVFVKGRVGDRIGLVVFAETAQLQCPLTTNHGIFLGILKRLRLPTERELAEMESRGEPIFGSRTAIGKGIAAGVKRLENSRGKSRIMILLTDGNENVNEPPPLVAADIAKALGVKIYTIGAGSGASVQVVRDFFGGYAFQRVAESDLDEDMLKSIAARTGGKYFRARDEKSLREIYKAIDRMEKVKTEIKYVEFNEKFASFLWPALCLLIIELLLANTRFLKLP